MKNINHKQGKKQWIAIGAFILMAMILLIASRRVTGFSEWYGQTVYPVLVRTIGRVTGWFSFSVTEIGLYAVILLMFWILIRWFCKPMVLIRKCSFLLAALFFLYAACCGVNYYRIPFSFYYMKQHEIMKSEECGDLRELCGWLTEKVNEARGEFDAGEEMYQDLQEKGVAAMKRLAEQYPVLAGHYPQAKPILLSEILSMQQCTGVYSPFTVEANYNRDMVSYNIPLTICHEMSHLRGFMREDEANFIGYLACLGSEDADYRYSGYLLGWVYAGNALAKVDYEAYVKNYGMLSEAVRKDLNDNHEFWERYEGIVAETQEKVNDAYLKVNGQAEGVQTYGRVVDLMLLDFQYRK